MEGSKIHAVAVDKSQPASLLREDEEKKTKSHHDVSLPVIIQLVSSWSLCFAFTYGAMAAHHIYGEDITCDQSSFWTSCYILTGSAGDEATKLVSAMLWSSVAQAAVAVLALLPLPPGPARRCCSRLVLGRARPRHGQPLHDGQDAPPLPHCLPRGRPPHPPSCSPPCKYSWTCSASSPCFFFFFFENRASSPCCLSSSDPTIRRCMTCRSRHVAR